MYTNGPPLVPTASAVTTKSAIWFAITYPTVHPPTRTIVRTAA